ncbi:hypothetical protein RhiirC2_798385 [Rhizophagus irregularis]|uniref:Protein kinase domain-containing protein n=1 Tax=Rhizophagus irregularis TaxID=588596 RepID=A0A2N1M6I5_9GLOM|nr:hypothetical protein RhiirC2_798385 [Rhizophagus irregularis]
MHTIRSITVIGSGGFASVYTANWKNTPSCQQYMQLKKSVYLTIRASSYEKIIQFCGVTKFEDKKKNSLILEYANGRTSAPPAQASS